MYELDADLKPVKHYYLASEEQARLNSNLLTKMWIISRSKKEMRDLASVPQILTRCSCKRRSGSPTTSFSVHSGVQSLHSISSSQYVNLDIAGESSYGQGGGPGKGEADISERPVTSCADGDPHASRPAPRVLPRFLLCVSDTFVAVFVSRTNVCSRCSCTCVCRHTVVDSSCLSEVVRFPHCRSDQLLRECEQLERSST